MNLKLSTRSLAFRGDVVFLHALGTRLHTTFSTLNAVSYFQLFMYLFAEEGQLYTFGSDYWGCIGCDNKLDEEVKLPYRVEFFSENPVEQLACGECHVVALTGRNCCQSSVWGGYAILAGDKELGRPFTLSCGCSTVTELLGYDRPHSAT